MRVFDFTHAIVRTPGRSVVGGIRSDASAVPDYDGILKEHAAYVAALSAAGLKIDVLPPLEEFPDSVFVEDPALVFGEGAILLRPGVASRLGEAEHMRGPLGRHFDRVLELEGDEYADGGDVLVTPGEVLIGLSKRTTPKGAQALSRQLAALGRAARIVETPHRVLHFKTASSLLSEDTVMVTGAMAGAFAGLKVIVVPDGEEGAANFLRINDTVFVGDCYPRTLDLLLDAGFAAKGLAIREIAKLDAGLSCMSLRWHA
ncbi:MAG TPA: arginine deiminase family protein [Rhizomicrobium sp.]